MAQTAAQTLIFVVLLMAPMVLSMDYDHDHHNKKPKETKFTVYAHAFAQGPKANFGPVAGVPGSPRDPSQFGTVFVGNLLVTRGMSLYSPEVGRAPGIQAVTSPNGTTAYNSFSILFTKGDYKGSTLEFQGISSSDKVYELSVFGTKSFRYARGCAVSRLVFQNPSIQYIVTELNITVRYKF